MASPLLHFVHADDERGAGSLGETQTGKIVGLGAATCKQFNGDVAANPTVQRDYLAWAQGFMSGVLAQAPQGVDEGLDLTPPSVPLQRQAALLREFCSKNQEQSYADAGWPDLCCPIGADDFVYD